MCSDGTVNDHDRLTYLDAHFRAAHDAPAAMDLRGFFVWSLFDNFVGRGLFAALRDRARRLRHPEAHPKASALWYRDVMAANGLSGPPP